MYRPLKLAVVASLACLTAAPLAAQDPKRAYLDPEEAGPDFQVQGEYEGTIGRETKVGAQVIALGDGKFDAVVYAKGLPGAGWDEKTKTRLSGETTDGVTRLEGKNFKGEIRDGRFTGTAEEDVQFDMKKVERKSPTLGAKPPEGALVLFDGTNVEEWRTGKIEEDMLLGVPARTEREFKDFTFHMEFRTPFMPYARGQGRGNSGLYLIDQYEVQVLDSFGLEGRDNECGGIYQIAAPKVNMCLPPLSWQTYDVEFKAARFDDGGNKVSDAVTTVKHNGVVIHEERELPRPTPGGGRNDEKPGPIYLQDHGDPLRFRNIWIIEK